MILTELFLELDKSNQLAVNSTLAANCGIPNHPTEKTANR